MNWLGMLSVVLVITATGLEARADRIGDQSRQIRESDNAKRRVSAALFLANAQDPRAIAALADALVRDRDAAVRRIAALSLGENVGTSTPPRERRAAIESLAHAARADRDPRVRRNAGRSLARVQEPRGAGRSSRSRARSGGVYLAIGKPGDRSNQLPRGAAAQVLGTLQNTLSSEAPSFAHSTNLDALPTSAELSAMGAQAFFIGASVASLRVAMRGRRAEISCTVSIRISPWSGRDGNERLIAGKAATASGSGRVSGSASKAGIASAKRDCATAVVEQIVTRHVVPFIERTANSERMVVRSGSRRARLANRGE